jgi:NodT family efflux transporter outer membrane factor (OMF) lipoprotein
MTPPTKPVRLTPCRLLPAMLALLISLGGCTTPRDYLANGLKVGPNYGRPPAPVAKDWIDAADRRVRNGSNDLSEWWTTFKVPGPNGEFEPDSVLNGLICFAYNQNLTLRQAGFRVLEARAQLGITTGQFFPQVQDVHGDYNRNISSLKDANRSFLSNRYSSQFDLGFNLAWELDFWGRFRRAIESASKTLDASVENYDDVLVTLLGDVATNYVQMRTFEKRIVYAEKNVEIQRATLKIAEARKEGGVVAGLDVIQARSILEQTQAQIPELQISLRQTINQLCVLLGIPPEDLGARLGPPPKELIPTAPENVAIGIPADLLRRRPDVRRAERLAAAQSAQIGVAEADFYPHIAISGTIGYSAAQFKDLFTANAVTGSIGPSFQWNVLNYGRILNNVRLQDATFNELVTAYQNTVLNANQEVENGLVTFLRAQKRTEYQKKSVEDAEKAVKIIITLYDAGTVDFTRVTQIQQNLVQQQDTLAQAQGEIALGLITAFKALGGGWQIRQNGCDGAGLQSPTVADASSQFSAPLKHSDQATSAVLPASFFPRAVLLTPSVK